MYLDASKVKNTCSVKYILRYYYECSGPVVPNMGVGTLHMAAYLI